MADENTLAKVQRVYHVNQKVKIPSGKVYRYPHWEGYYREDGKRFRVYLGRDLPERFKGLLITRVRTSRGWKEVDPYAVRAVGR